LISILESSNRI